MTEVCNYSKYILRLNCLKSQHSTITTPHAKINI